MLPKLCQTTSKPGFLHNSLEFSSQYHVSSTKRPLTDAQNEYVDYSLFILFLFNNGVWLTRLCSQMVRHTHAQTQHWDCLSKSIPQSPYKCFSLRSVIRGCNYSLLSAGEQTRQRCRNTFQNMRLNNARTYCLLCDVIADYIIGMLREEQLDFKQTCVMRPAFECGLVHPSNTQRTSGQAQTHLQINCN